VDAELRRAMCLILPSRREGLGLGIVEALARGTPAVVARGPDNAATELIEEHYNGFVAESAEPVVLARAIVAVHEAGPRLLDRTRSWFAAHAARLTIDGSLVELEAVYADAVNGAAARVNGHRLRKPVRVDPVSLLGTDDTPT
jgi:glycosyltransferase involved in cell wall biosynthesis